MTITCYDASELVLDNASVVFGEDWMEDQQLRRDFQSCCEEIDIFAEECGADSYSIEVDEQTTEIRIGVVFRMLSAVYRRGSRFYNLVRRSKKISISPYEDSEFSCLTFTIPGIWVPREPDLPM